MAERSAKMIMRMSLWIDNQEGELLFGDGRHQILQAVDKHGSLSAAAEALGMSYRGLWARIRHSEKRLGFALIESHAGRGPSSGTSLTPDGRALMERYSQLLARVQGEAAVAFADVFPGGSGSPPNARDKRP